MVDSKISGFVVGEVVGLLVDVKKPPAEMELTSPTGALVGESCDAPQEVDVEETHFGQGSVHQGAPGA
jgi:hypothetical protein